MKLDKVFHQSLLEEAGGCGGEANECRAADVSV